MVNLQEFIAEALVQIVEGVRTAQARVGESGAKINPTAIYIGNEGPPQWDSDFSRDRHYGQIVEFDVAVAATDKENLKGGIGVVGVIVGMGYKAEKGKDSSTVSRIKFSVPVFLPQQEVDTK
jgi:hypothetical protein